MTGWVPTLLLGLLITSWLALGQDIDWQEQTELLWSQYLADVRGAIAREDFYSAKQALSHLESLNPERFLASQLNATRAWVAMTEGNWATAARAYGRTTGEVLPARLALERALCLQKLGRYEEALADLEAVRPRIRDRRLNWEWNFMKGECARLAGKSKQAIAAYRNLRYRPVPTEYRVEAYRQLAELYYRRGSRKSGRAAALTVQSRWPISDEALETVALQQTYESVAYRNDPKTLARFAWVCYRNREYDRSDTFYAQVLDSPAPRDITDRALYFSTITPIKREDPLKAVDALESAYPRLVGTKYEGPAAFQYARVLFMLGRDADVIDFVEAFWRDGKDAKWRQECVKLKVLALRRMDRYDAFLELGRQLEATQAKPWLLRFYYRNGVAWALEREDPDQAVTFLDRCQPLVLDKAGKLEFLLWEGLIHWQQDQRQRAIDTWLRVLLRDPNHYFGLVVQHLIRGLPASAIAAQEFLDQAHGDLTNLEPDTLKKLYYLLGDGGEPRQRVTRAVRDLIPKLDLSGHEDLDPQCEAAHWASIARFDLAGDELRHRETSLSKQAYHLLKARWFRIGQRPNSSIYHAEILAKALPSWVPMELLDDELQTLLFPIVFSPLIQANADAHHVDAFLLLALIREESRFDVGAKSVASARGLMQFIPSTARSVAFQLNGQDDFDLGALYRPETSIELGAAYLDSLLDSFGGVSLFSIAAYNAGRDAVQRWRSLSQKFDPLTFVWDITYQETRDYCQKVLQSYYQYRRIYVRDQSESVILTPPIPHPPQPNPASTTNELSRKPKSVNMSAK